MRRIIALVIGVVGLSAATIGAVQLGGDDKGVIPTTRKTASCEGKVARAIAKAAAKITKCHVRAALLAVKKKSFDEEACENAAGRALDKPRPHSCPPCVSLVTASGVAQLLDGGNGLLFCGGTSSFGGDDSGKVPPDLPTEKCEARAAAAYATLVAKIIGCHVQAVLAARKAGTFDDAAEDACEKSAKDGFTQTSIDGCACVNLSQIASLVEVVGDQTNGQVFCSSSPSGAFIDGALG